jgi:hypothetical protein
VLMISKSLASTVALPQAFSLLLVVCLREAEQMCFYRFVAVVVYHGRLVITC